jgi:RNA polymerase sigma-70 factor (ECF subfamily)
MIETLQDNRSSVQELLEHSEIARALKKASETLSASDQLFMKLHYEKDLPPEEIAGIMNVSVSTIYSRKNRIREKIKKILMDRGVVARNPE